MTERRPDRPAPDPDTAPTSEEDAGAGSPDPGTAAVSRRRRRSRRRLWRVAGVLVALGIALVGVRTWRAAQAGLAGRRVLLRAETELGARRLDAARSSLTEARTQFSRARWQLDALGPLLSVARTVPLLRVQVRGAELMADSGLLLSEAGLRLEDATAAVLHPADERQQVSVALESLRRVQATLRSGVSALDKASAKVRALDGYRLFGPLARAHDDLARRLPEIRARATSAESGMAAIVNFAGGSGPRRWLLLSQNPDEVRPTGGFIGTYGLLVADGRELRLERYDSIERWTTTHVDAVVPSALLASPFRLSEPPLVQNLANVNAGPDWPHGARLAADLWERGGEEPVDGVVAFTPGLQTRILAVTGPVTLPAYGETVTAANVVERLDFYTHGPPSIDDPDRKGFVADLAQATLQALLAAPAAQWDPLARAVGASLDAQEVVAWSSRPELSAELARRHWDGAVPVTVGDFVGAEEFAYEAKNGHSLHRTYDHTVSLRPDGSGHVVTKVTISDTHTAEDSLSYITMRGPAGGTLAGDADADAIAEPDVAGHPGFGWFRAAPPMGETTLTVAWDAPDIARRDDQGRWSYSLWWRRIVDHPGDVLHLEVNLPAGWRWKGEAPPGRIDLSADVVRTWAITTP